MQDDRPDEVIVVRGAPSDTELAAVIAVLYAAARSEDEPLRPARGDGRAGWHRPRLAGPHDAHTVPRSWQR